MKYISQREKIFIVCIVLLIHILFIYLIAHLQSHHNPSTIPELDRPLYQELNTMQKKERDEPWVSHSGDGAPISFASENSESKNTQESDNENINENDDIIEAIPTTSKINAKKKDEKIIPTPKEPNISILGMEGDTTSTPYSKTESTNLPKKRLPSFTEIAQGFAKHMRHTPPQGTGFNTTSSYYGKISGKQIACEQYENKVVRAICNTFRVHRDEMPRYQQRQCAGIHFTLDRDGKIINLHMLISTGNQHVDGFVLGLIRKASIAFPQLPAAIQENMYEFPVIQFKTINDFFSAPHAWHRTSGH